MAGQFRCLQYKWDRCPAGPQSAPARSKGRLVRRWRERRHSIARPSADRAEVGYSRFRRFYGMIYAYSAKLLLFASSSTLVGANA
jgi:hypothetical protein